MTIQEEFATIQALKYVSMKAPYQPTKDGMA